MPAAIVFDARRILERRDRASPTGIDRVVLAYARWLLAQPHLVLAPVSSWGGRIVPLRRESLARLVDAASRETAAAKAGGDEDGAWRRLMANLGSRPHAGPALRAGAGEPNGGWMRRTTKQASMLLRGRSGRLTPGVCYLNVGHSGLDHPELLAQIALRGAAPAVMIHDLIPITHPEYCGPGAPERHRRRLDATLAHAEIIIANSASTAEDIAAYARRHGRRLPRIHVGLLGVEPAFAQARAEPIVAPPYFVCVGTIEARKNLAFLLALWRRLAERMGALAPHLVLVGRRGWENEAVIDHLDRSPAVTSLVHEVANLGDAHLASLVAGARALLAPSLAEGFDLPVVEALSLGTPVIASDIVVHRELASPAQLIDPLDGPAWLAAIQAACVTGARAAPYEAPGWEAHFEGVGAALGLGVEAPRIPSPFRARYA
ncbi:MAG: glycosyltransferase family 4 protein [Caulobacteraceae bacterium]